MQITCTICSDLFVPLATVVSTNCGHLFHHECLLQWLERSKTCPQCRAKSSEKNVIRIFFNFLNLAAEDSNTLQNKVDSLDFQIRLKDNEIKKMKDDLSAQQTKSKGLAKEVRRLQDEVRSAESNFNCLKEQFGIMKKRNNELESAKQECENLRKQITHMRNIEKIVQGTSEEVDDMLHDYSSSESVESLLTFTSILKKEMQAVTAKKKEVTSKLREAESKVYSLSSELQKLKAEAEEDARHAEEERRSLQRKVRALEEALASPGRESGEGGCKGCRGSKGALRRLLRESPAPAVLTPPTPCPLTALAGPEQPEAPDAKDTAAAGPSGSDMVSDGARQEVIQDVEASVGDQTPLRAPRSIGPVPGKIQPRSLAISANSGIGSKMSIFRKASRINSLTLRRDGGISGLGSGFCTNLNTGQDLHSSEGEVYDGFGGHSKPDYFPRPILQGKVKKNVSRVQPVSKIKLKDATNSLKMDLFLNK